MFASVHEGKKPFKVEFAKYLKIKLNFRKASNYVSTLYRGNLEIEDYLALTNFSISRFDCTAVIRKKGQRKEFEWR